jgi:hypothetical protein
MFCGLVHSLHECECQTGAQLDPNDLGTGKTVLATRHILYGDPECSLLAATVFDQDILAGALEFVVFVIECLVMGVSPDITSFWKK